METLAVRNQNPGNLRDPSTGGFQSFSDPIEGKAALYNDLTAKMTGQSQTGLNGKSSLLDFAKTYAPAGDNNDPVQYAANLANKMGVSPDTPIGTLMPRIDDFASAVASNEDPSAKYTQHTPLQINGSNFVDQVPSSQPVEQQREDLKKQGEPVSTDPNRVKPTVLGGIVRGLLHMPAQVVTSLGQAGETLTGNKLTEPFSGSYLGRVQPLGAAKNATVEQGTSTATPGRLIGQGVKAGVEAGLYGDAPELKGLASKGLGAVKGLVKGTDILASDAVTNGVLRATGIPKTVFSTISSAEKLNALTEAAKLANPADKLVIDQAIKQITPAAIKEAGGKVAFAELHPATSRLLGLGGKVLKYAGGAALASAGLDKVKNLIK